MSKRSMNDHEVMIAADTLHDLIGENFNKIIVEVKALSWEYSEDWTTTSEDGRRVRLELIKQLKHMTL